MAYIILPSRRTQYRGARAFTTAGVKSLNLPRAIVSTFPITLACRFKFSALPGAGTEGVLISLGNSGRNDRFWIAYGGVNNDIYCDATSNGNIYRRTIFSPSLSVGVWYSAVATFSGAGSQEIYCNTFTSDTGSGTGQTPEGLNDTRIGGFIYSGGDYGNINGSIADAAFYSGVLSASEITAYGNGTSPLDIRRSNLVSYLPFFQPGNKDAVSGFEYTNNGGVTIDSSVPVLPPVLTPAPRRLYFGTSGGGANIFESTFADSWSLSDTYSASATLVSTYADSPTVTDSSSSSAVFASAFDETIPVSDGPSADMGGVTNRTQEESFTITDAYSASMVANATISETLSAEASASASAIFNATFAETLPIVDGEEADAGRISDIAENATVTDAYTAGIVAQATQAESVTTIDTYDTIAIYNPLLAETLPITDTVGATLTVPTSGTVDLSQESIDSLAHEIMVQLTSTPVRKL